MENHLPNRDYASNAALDTYSQADIDDTSSLPALTRAQRLAADRQMARRDRGLQAGAGSRAARRSRAPAFLQSDDDGAEGEEGAVGRGLLDGIETRRRRRQYDERVEEDDAADVEDVSTESRCRIIFFLSRNLSDFFSRFALTSIAMFIFPGNLLRTPR